VKQELDNSHVRVEWCSLPKRAWRSLRAASNLLVRLPLRPSTDLGPEFSVREQHHVPYEGL